MRISRACARTIFGAAKTPMEAADPVNIDLLVRLLRAVIWCPPWPMPCDVHKD